MTAPRPRRRRLAVLPALATLLVSASLMGHVGLAGHGRLAGSAAGDEPVSQAVRLPDDGVQARTYALTLSGPTSVVAGSRFRVHGMTVVDGLRGDRRHRRVLIETLRGGAWRVVARTRTAVDGRYAVRIAAGSTVRVRYLRARTTAAGRLPAVRTGRLRTRVTARPPKPAAGAVIPGTAEYDAAEALPTDYTPGGSPSDWTYLFKGNDTTTPGARWDPCTVVRWAYNPAGERYDALRDVQRAVAKVAGVTGLHFQYVGTTDFVYDATTLDGFPADAAIAVGWSNAAAYPALAGDVVGRGGARGVRISGADVGVRLTQGWVTLDNDSGTALAPGFDGTGWGQIMMHEVLHSLGADHASGAAQVMYPTAGARNFRFGAGDITAMDHVGATRTPACLS